MEKLLNAYTNAFSPDIKFRDFSEETIKRIWKNGSKMFLGCDGVWYTLMKEKVGEALAMELERQVWRRFTPLEPRFVAEALNIERGQGDVASLFKLFQLDAGAGAMMPELDLKLTNDNRGGVMTVVHCGSLEYFEKHNWPDDEIRWMCVVIDGAEVETYARVVNDRIIFIPKYLPPRKPEEKSGPCCVLEYKLDESVPVQKRGTDLIDSEGLLEDYGGEFRPGVKFRDFAEEPLMRLWRSGGKQAHAIDGIWYQVVKERNDEKTALKLEAEMWNRFVVLQARWMKEALNITGNDVASVFKALQFDQRIGGVCPEIEWELPDNNHGMMTVNRCLPLEYFERHAFSDDAIRWLSRAVGVAEIEHYAQEFNPRIKVTPHLVPPRRSKDQPVAKIEFTLEK